MNDIAFGNEILLLKKGVGDHVEKDFDGALKGGTGVVDIITGVVKRGEGVDFATKAFDVVSNLGTWSFFGPFKKHMFKKVGDAVIFLLFKGTSRAKPDLSRAHGRTWRVDEEGLEAIFQF